MSYPNFGRSLSAIHLFLAILILAATAFLAPVRAAAQTGTAASVLLGSLSPEKPIRVAAGVKITQITGVDQRAENFGVVARIILRWQDDKLAFDPKPGEPGLRTADAYDFLAETRNLGIFTPVATIENQQARSFAKSAFVSWAPDGTAHFFSEVIVTLQAPDFDFRRFPFDHQSFFLRLIANAPREFIQFEPLADSNGLGDTLGEEEWKINSVWSEVDEIEGLSGLESSRFSLGFSASRHILYYWARIFVPVILLIIVGWANLFLEEYRRRIDIASGNLLAFIAYNFTISGELPRLGYLTFLDSLMMAVFFLSVASVVYNVAMRRLSLAGREDRAKNIDWHITHWGYPALFILTVILLRQVFFTDDTLLQLW